jgi:hypothetical protein
MKRRVKLAIPVALFLAASAVGCATVAPWERGILARPEMSPDAHPACNAYRRHVYSSREGASGGDSGTSGGCGCY